MSNNDPDPTSDKEVRAWMMNLIATSPAGRTLQSIMPMPADLEPVARRQACDECRAALLTLAKYARGYSAKDIAQGLASARNPRLVEIREAIAFAARLGETLKPDLRSV